MSTTPELTELVKRVHKRINSATTKADLEQLFSLGDDEAYTRDSPRSVGRHLRILSIEFSGVKQTGEPLHYTRKPETGVNLWVGENLVGKSTIFKSVKFALTGNNSFVDDVGEWIKTIWVEFTLGAQTHTAHIFKRPADRNFIFEFYSLSRDELGDMDAEEIEDAADFRGNKGDYEAYVEKFFFKEFDYYKMQWTSSRSGQKDQVGLQTNNTSWQTYFKSIYLEADDALVFGSQTELVLQMLFGLELTYPINRLKMEKEKKQSTLGLLKSQSAAAATSEQTQSLQKDIQHVEVELMKLQETKKAANASVAPSSARDFEIALNRQNTAITQSGLLSQQLLQLTADQSRLQAEEKEFKQKIYEFGNEASLKKKRSRFLQDQEQFGAFFNELEVSICPSCSHEVETIRVEHERQTGNCRLCTSHMPPDQPVVEPGTHQEEVKQLEDEATKLIADQYYYRVKRSGVLKSLEDVGKQLDDVKAQQLANTSAIPIYAAQVQTLQQALSAKPVTFDVDKYIEDTTALLQRKAELNAELNALIQPAADSKQRLERLENEINWLHMAQEELGNLRNERSSDLLEDFEKLYLKLLQEFGLPNCESVKIDDKFKFTYQFSGTELSFAKLAPGAQLRAKLGMYIAIIQLDVQLHHGRHPRFIILDSPAGQEADRRFVEALKDALAYIEANMKEDLQVFVGTAVRTLAAAVTSDKMDWRDEPDPSGRQYFF
ncbi:MAG TPA: hypothetical protein VFO93_11915 [Hymenobacter sp.]|uniref:hypothetical protein n=1 Tax=Hymenobacter sp. TaxID=1898978 RepID=UPI002D80A624|nr:hypothetical protein [Hymenobacter sp.]HET9504240.1 hypothetical protein [Hymenobacter sp.]